MAVVVVAIALVWLIGGHDVSLTVNGEQVMAHDGAMLTAVIAEHEAFGARPGRLLSVTGAVLDEAGGLPYTVERAGVRMTAEEVATARVEAGDTLLVGNGADVEEPSTEEVVIAHPNIVVESGGAISYVSQWGRAGEKRVKRGATSGETVDIEVLEEARDMHVASLTPNPAGGKYVALTFDDGPSAYTPQILAVLEEEGVRATFFNLGAEAEKSPAGTKAIVDAGSELASHTMAHANLPTLDKDSLRAEIDRATEALHAASGVTTRIIRAPYGAFTAAEWARAGDIVACNVLWTQDSRDWERPGPDAIVDNALRGVQNGSIILMHDGGGNREQTAEALPRIIDTLREQGFEFVTVTELMELDGRFPKHVVAGKASPEEGFELPDDDATGAA